MGKNDPGGACRRPHNALPGVAAINLFLTFFLISFIMNPKGALPLHFVIPTQQELNLMTLTEFFHEHPKVALGFSGGVDSSFLLWAGRQTGADIHPYYIKTAFQPEFEYQDALRLCRELGAELTVLELDALADPRVTANPANRCYFCKVGLFGTLSRRALADGYTVLLDGTNASDDAGDRPGMKALQELQVLSPLRLCGLTKAEIRRQSREAGLFTWNKPAYACLATRIPTGEEITLEKLQDTEKAEGYLFSLGFSDFRVRKLGNSARIQLPEDQIPNLMAHRREILTELKKYYKNVLLDLEVRP